VRFGLNFPLAGVFSDVSLVSELAREAEMSGWDGCFVWDHLRVAGARSNADPWVSLALIAHATSRIKIGPLVTPIYRRHLGKLAQETATIDHLSNGRLVMGVGLGSDEFGEITAFGGPLDDGIRSEMLDEGLQILTGLWTGEPLSFEGKHYHNHQAQIVPSCLQSPRIPIWVAASYGRKRPMRRAARFDGVVTVRGDMVSELTASATQEMVTFIRNVRTSESAFDIVHFERTSERSAADARDHVRSYVEMGVTWWIETMPFDSDDLNQIRDQIHRGPPRLG
jgi:alkanesulfonate monooxygenase SsuD/methylene tetrahydromethanopterin reductase-like flavin-dependent oxidoreductase (luciferase family)